MIGALCAATRPASVAGFASGSNPTAEGLFDASTVSRFQRLDARATTVAIDADSAIAQPTLDPNAREAASSAASSTTKAPLLL